MYPSVVKFDHHHEQECKSTSAEGHNFKNFHTPCSICEFEFSSFETSSETEFSIFKTDITSSIKFYSDFLPSYNSRYSFSLRAPPAQKV